MTERNIQQFVEKASEDEVLKDRTQIGWCRIWTDRVYDLAKELDIKSLDISIEAREVQTELGVFHTFIKLVWSDKSYFWDGIGTPKFAPYFGLEEEAPDHLKNSSLDMISRIRSV